MELINELGIVSVAGITAICLLVGMWVKSVENIDNKFIPCIVGTVGAVLGVVAMFIMPDFPAHDYINAIAVGIASGLASTGLNELVKGLTEK